MTNEIIMAMEKCMAHIKYYYEEDYHNAIKLREIEYRLGVWYGYGRALEIIDKEKYWDMQERYWDNIKTYSAFCRKVTRDIVENKEV